MKYTGTTNKKIPNQVVSGATILKYWSSDILTASEHAGFHIRPVGFYEVTWGDNVVAPQFNCECIILKEVIDEPTESS